MPELCSFHSGGEGRHKLSEGVSDQLRISVLQELVGLRK